MQFLVIAKDGTDEGALERRQRTRPAHLAGIGPLVESGNVLVGGAILSEAGDMVGSMLLVEYRPERTSTPGSSETRTSWTGSGMTSRCTRSARPWVPGSRSQAQRVALTARIAMSSLGSPDPWASTAPSIRSTISEAVAPASP
jgi:uncharacterized protein YciI